MPIPPKDLFLFCRVVDNFGDIGVCWRLARQLREEFSVNVTLWVDDLASFVPICPEVMPALNWQEINGVTVRHWMNEGIDWSQESVPDVVIEAFACELPETWIARMAAASHAPVWINLEYLSAESWARDCHGLPSRHPQSGLQKHFFFPGWETGGLLREHDLLTRRERFDIAARAAYLQKLGVPWEPEACYVSVFCYPQAPVVAMLRSFAESGKTVHCLIPQGVAQTVPDAIQDGNEASGKVQVHRIPFVPQAEFDHLLWVCDMNWVRGEDSFVRAQWAGLPFVWHIYPQSDEAHRVKLDAFLERYLANADATLQSAIRCIWYGWNGFGETDFSALHNESIMQCWRSHAEAWCAREGVRTDLATQLVAFVGRVRA